MIDTHAHITSRFCKDINSIIDGARSSGVNKIILSASNLEESEENIKLSQENEIFAACIGIHPQQTDTWTKLTIDEQINQLDLLAENKYVVAIGECGLDFSPPPPEERERPRKEQEILFRGQVAVAVKHNKPLVIHARKAADETIEILSMFKDKIKGGVFHCYTGGKKRVQKVLDLGDGWYFGIDGNITYEDGLIEVVDAIPRDRLILETDSPFLTPNPHRGEVNKPEYVKYIYAKIAEIWRMSLKDAERMIDENAKRLFIL